MFSLHQTQINRNDTHPKTIFFLFFLFVFVSGWRHLYLCFLCFFSSVKILIDCNYRNLLSKTVEIIVLAHVDGCVTWCVLGGNNNLQLDIPESSASE